MGLPKLNSGQRENSVALRYTGTQISMPADQRHDASQGMSEVPHKRIAGYVSCRQRVESTKRLPNRIAIRLTVGCPLDRAVLCGCYPPSHLPRRQNLKSCRKLKWSHFPTHRFRYNNSMSRSLYRAGALYSQPPEICVICVSFLCLRLVPFFATLRTHQMPKY